MFKLGSHPSIGPFFPLSSIFAYKRTYVHTSHIQLNYDGKPKQSQKQTTKQQTDKRRTWCHFPMMDANKQWKTCPFRTHSKFRGHASLKHCSIVTCSPHGTETPYKIERIWCRFPIWMPKTLENIAFSHLLAPSHTFSHLLTLSHTFSHFLKLSHTFSDLL